MTEEAITALRAGFVVGLPTDTLYGLAVDPHNELSVERLFEMKGRPSSRPVSLLVASVEAAEEIIELSSDAKLIASKYWPGAVTLVGHPRTVFPPWIGEPTSRTVGVRVPDQHDALSILEVMGALAVTSANISGQPETLSDREAQAVFGASVAFYVPGVCFGAVASTVVDVTGSPRVLRQGPVDPTL